jgi:hypothetical protein
MPTWLKVIAHINPLSYIVEAMRALLVTADYHPPGPGFRCYPAGYRYSGGAGFQLIQPDNQVARLSISGSLTKDSAIDELFSFPRSATPE